MDIVAFEALLDRHGGDIAVWPTDRDAAQALLTSDVEARRALRATRDVEVILGATRVGLDRPASMDRMAEIASRQRQTRPVPNTARRVGWAAAAALVLAMGVAVGDLKPTHDDGTDAYLAASLDPAGVTDVE